MGGNLVLGSWPGWGPGVRKGGVWEAVWASTRAEAPWVLTRKPRPQQSGDRWGCTAHPGRAGPCPQPPASRACRHARARAHSHAHGYRHMGAHTFYVWVALLRSRDPRRVGQGHSSMEPLPFPGGRVGGCPGIRKSRGQARRKPLFCVLFLVRKMKWLLGANKGPLETCCSLSHSRGPSPFSCPPPSQHWHLCVSV